MKYLFYLFSVLGAISAFLELYSTQSLSLDKIALTIANLALAEALDAQERKDSG